MNKLIQIKNPNGLYGKALIRMYEVQMDTKGTKVNGTIPYSYFYEKLGRNFSMKKFEIRELLYFFKDLGMIEINCRGIKLNFIIKNE